MEEVFYKTANNGSFSADKELYSKLGYIAREKVNGRDESMVIKAIIEGSFSELAQLIEDAGFMSYDEAYNKWFSIGSESSHIIKLSRGEKTYRMGTWVDATNTKYYPIGEGRGLREEARQNIKLEIQRDMAQAYNDERSAGWNLYLMALRKFALPKEEEPEQEPEQQPEPEQESKPEIQHTETVRERIIEREKTGVLEGMLQQMVCEVIANVTINDMIPRIKENIIKEFGFEPQVHEIVMPDGEKQKFQGLTHEAFDEVLFFIANDIPVYLYGPAGSGKNVLTEQAAEALGLDFYFMNSVTDEYKITGFIDAGGTYHETEFYKAFVNGGVFFLDEMDASAPEVLVCLNAAIANRYFAFPTGAVKAHPDFRVVAAGNTLGTGADAMYTGRMQLDAATLNRFETIPVDYDERIDLLNADNDEELVEFIKGYRKALKTCGLASVASYRNIKMIKTAEKAMSLEKALCYSLTKEMNADDINTLIGSKNLPDNKYTEALKNIKTLVD